MTGTATYALASALTGTVSSVIDVGLVGCYGISITQTGASEAVQIWTSFDNNTYTAGNGGSATLWGKAVAGNYSIEKDARYLFFLVPARQGPSTYYVTPTATTVRVWIPTNWPY